ncbi:MAG: glycosyl hydrolase family 95 catalytic domain-containing protein [Planctomycetota bacterium]|jgi:hypothetical protein
MHTIQVDQLVLEAEEGLMLGNGDLSVSVFQRSGELVWRFGKNDVWDRRYDRSDSPEPAHIEEIARGLREQGWKGGGYDAGGEGSAAGSKLSEAEKKRVGELMSGTPCYARRPYPCPKPVGELILNIPTDHRGWTISQRVHVEKAELEIEMKWENGAEIRCRCFIPPKPNVLVVDWEVVNWNDDTSLACETPVWFTLYRWLDPTIREHAARHYRRHRYHHFFGSLKTDKCTPLAPPTVEEIDGLAVIQQTFDPDIQFPQGFRYLMAPLAEGTEIKDFNLFDEPGACILIQPDKDARTGSIAVAVPTSSDEGDVEAELQRVRGEVGSDLAAAAKKWDAANAASAEEFWARSSITLDDKILEDVWYASLHARRCAYRGDVIAPGLALPSTVGDYSFWHGDYHMNYNYQQPFYGDYTANQVDMGDSFFPGMAYMVELGRMLARKYWNGNRGTFIQVTGYPFPIDDDPYGNGPLARMAYMTGWVTNFYWWRYLYTLDKDWLEDYGYPVIRDTAVFYLDFLAKVEDGGEFDDGKYHAYPSPQGEYLYTGDMKDYFDQAQVIRNARWCLQAAVAAADVLGTDKDLRDQWQDILDNLVVVDDLDELGFDDEAKRQYFYNEPAFIGIDIGKHIPRPGDAPEWLKKPFHSTANLPWQWMIEIRNRAFVADRDLPVISEWVQQWRAPNGACRAMGTQGLGFIGHYGEAEGILQPLQEMMLQSWDGCIRIFDAWPKDMNGSFTTLRAQGAFLVSAAHEGGKVGDVTLMSEKGAPCRVGSPWDGGVSVSDSAGNAVETTVDELGITCFDTSAGETYTLSAAK